MTRFPTKTTLATLALSASVGFALPAAADSVHHVSHHHMMHGYSSAHHASHRQAFDDGYARGFRDGHYAAATGEVPEDQVVTGRSAYVGPGPDGYGDRGIAGNGGLLGLGILGGDGFLGTGVLDGQGALGVGVLGF